MKNILLTLMVFANILSANDSEKNYLICKNKFWTTDSDWRNVFLELGGKYFFIDGALAVPKQSDDIVVLAHRRDETDDIKLKNSELVYKVGEYIQRVKIKREYYCFEDCNKFKLNRVSLNLLWDDEKYRCKIVSSRGYEFEMKKWREYIDAIYNKQLKKLETLEKELRKKEKEFEDSLKI